MAGMSGNDKSSIRDFGDSSKLTDWILYLGVTCHLTPHISDCIPGLLEDTDKYIRYLGDSSQLTNWILYSGETCHMTPQVQDFIPGSLEDTDKYIEVADGNHVKLKQKVQVKIKMCDDNGDTFIAKLLNVFLAPDICDRLFSIIKLMNLVNVFLLHKGLCTV